MTRRVSHALHKRANDVVEDGSPDGDDKRKCMKGDATLDHLAKTVADLRGRLPQVHNTGSPNNQNFRRRNR